MDGECTAVSDSGRTSQTNHRARKQSQCGECGSTGVQLTLEHYESTSTWNFFSSKDCSPTRTMAGCIHRGATKDARGIVGTEAKLYAVPRPPMFTGQLYSASRKGKDSPPLRLIPTATSLGTLRKRHPFSSPLALGQGTQLAGQSQAKRQLASVPEAKILCASQIHSKHFLILSVPWRHRPEE